MTKVTRNTRETKITIELFDDANASQISTMVPFLDHMLTALSRYANVGLRIDAKGDLRHHIVEDVAIALGIAFAARFPATAERFGERTIAMDDALVQCVVDIGGRPYYSGRLPSRLYDHWMRSFAANARTTLHVRVLRGTDRHHVVEAAFKALGLALRQAMTEGGVVFSTKGVVELELAP